MSKENIIELQRKNEAFNNTELGNLFNRFVSLHSSAWQFDGMDYITRSKKCFDQLEPIEKELREKLMKIAGVE
jgi:hypothetical protein